MRAFDSKSRVSILFPVPSKRTTWWGLRGYVLGYTHCASMLAGPGPLCPCARSVPASSQATPGAAAEKPPSASVDSGFPKACRYQREVSCSNFSSRLGLQLRRPMTLAD